ncbi:MAG: Vi polysaccharide biosynthesis protein VipB/TviC [Omnitrophica WOR_2 bacterium RIFOXYB2_FULL_38_16]|nr:MAG: Vi polysaccharide biosynthesis protein VipB/TviC [Omnitrophica WOR_2 bacterium RIFOXYB2_FULL_38_16]
MSKYLVAGGAGFIGSNIVEKLVKQGDKVRVLDNFSSGKEANLEFTKGLGADKYELIKGDIRQKADCLKACDGIDHVLLLAALRSVPRSLKDPASYNDVNINGVLCMLQAASQCGVKRLVFSSSSSVYGDTDQFPQKETQLPLLKSPYALSKLAGEYYCKIFSEFFNVETVSLRYFNVFGPKQALDDEYAVVIPKFIDCIMKGKEPPVFGDGLQSRDFTYIDNVVSANILAATAPGIKSEVFNVAVGTNNTVLNIVKEVNDILGKNVKPKFLDKRPGDVYKTHADIKSIKQKLGYKPLVNFREGLERTVEYFKKK